MAAFASRARRPPHHSTMATKRGRPRASEPRHAPEETDRCRTLRQMGPQKVTRLARDGVLVRLLLAQKLAPMLARVLPRRCSEVAQPCVPILQDEGLRAELQVSPVSFQDRVCGLTRGQFKLFSLGFQRGACCKPDEVTGNRKLPSPRGKQ